MTPKQRRIFFAGLLGATPFAIKAVMLRDEARYERGAAELYEQLVPGEGLRCVQRAADLERRAKEAEDDMCREAAMAARVADVLERWNPCP